MKRIILTCVLVCSIGLLWTGAAGQEKGPESQESKIEVDRQAVNSNQQTPTKSKASHWMEKKMRLSQSVFEGIAKGNFQQIGKSAREMKILSRAEHFVRSKPDSYRIQLKLFRFANDELMNAAKDESIESATLAFNQLTVSCVNCHKLIRTK